MNSYIILAYYKNYLIRSKGKFYETILCTSKDLLDHNLMVVKSKIKNYKSIEIYRLIESTILPC